MRRGDDRRGRGGSTASGSRKCGLRCLTFELTRATGRAGLARWPMIDKGGWRARAACLGASGVERGVRQHCGAVARQGPEGAMTAAARASRGANRGCGGHDPAATSARKLRHGLPGGGGPTDRPETARPGRGGYPRSATGCLLLWPERVFGQEADKVSGSLVRHRFLTVRRPGHRGSAAQWLFRLTPKAHFSLEHCRAFGCAA